MKESNLIRICLIGSVAGIISLYLISTFLLVPVDMNAGEISGSDVGKRVRISGTIQDFRVHDNGHYFFTLADDTGSIDAVIWEEKIEQLRLSNTDLSRFRNGANIQITGDVELYRGNPQVVI